jgi:nodulation protein E
MASPTSLRRSIVLRSKASGPSMQRVVVTGIGVVCALGLNRNEFWRALSHGESGIGPIPAETVGPSPDLSMNIVRFKNAGVVRGYDPQLHFPSKNLAFMDRFAQFAVVTAREAVEMAQIEWTDELRERAAIVTGSCVGGRSVEESGYWELFRCGRSRVHPMTIPLGMSNAGASHISIEFGIQGPSYSISTACSSSSHAIGQAFWMVRSGATPLALAGGSEAPLFLGSLKAWEAMRVVSTDVCRPFSADRSGMVLGEGAATLILESLESATARGVQPIGEIVGFGMSADACHITQPSAEGAAKAIRGALRDAELAPEQIGYINAHGTGTEANDRMETAAIYSVFGDRAHRLPVSSTKSMHGHTLGAAGAVEAAATILALQNGILPPTANFTAPDPACNLDVIPNRPRQAQVEAALSQSFAFGGLNAVLAFRAWK